MPSDPTKGLAGAPGILSSLPRGDRDEFAIPLYEERTAATPIPLVPATASATAAEPEMPAPAPVPAVRDFAGRWAHADLRRYARYLGMDGRTLAAIAAGVTLDGQPVTESDLAALLAEQPPQPAADPERIAPPAARINWPSAAARDLAERLRAALDVPGVAGAPRLRDLLRALREVLAEVHSFRLQERA